MYIYIYIYIDPTPRRPNQSYPNMSDPHVVGSTCGRAVTLDTALSGRKMVWPCLESFKCRGGESQSRLENKSDHDSPKSLRCYACSGFTNGNRSNAMPVTVSEVKIAQMLRLLWFQRWKSLKRYACNGFRCGEGRNQFRKRAPCCMGVIFSWKTTSHNNISRWNRYRIKAFEG